MLVFSEGVPRSGKSYDSIKNHILPALKKRRKVFARVNGLNHERIAAYLSMDVQEVRRLLVHVPTEQVKETFVARQNEAGEWSIADELRNALVVIDEVHDFYLADRTQPMSKESEEFFALHGHYGVDVLVMTQFYKRVHVALRARIERKNTFQKLSALGKRGEGMFRVTYWQTVAPDKYEKVGGENKKYDPAIYPLYHGISGGTEGGVAQEVYSGGRSNVWKSMIWRAVIIVPLGIGAVVFLLSFFTGGVSLVDQPEPDTLVRASPTPVQLGQVVPVAAPIPTAAEKRAAALAALTPQQRYVVELADAGRIRLSGVMQVDGLSRALVEWVDSSNKVIERLTLDQLRALGMRVQVHAFGVELLAGDQTIIATAWPRIAPERDASPRLYDTSGGLSARVEQSEPRPTTAASQQGGVISYSGAFPAGGSMGGSR